MKKLFLLQPKLASRKLSNGKVFDYVKLKTMDALDRCSIIDAAGTALSQPFHSDSLKTKPRPSHRDLPVN